ncbi:MAG: HAMP domain-containing histidine kinase [Myxococcales bacterium]|nr:HAMP domain-containing histidine kinase [Myxococcales bacterium]
MREISVDKAALSLRVYRSTTQVFARLIASAAHDLKSPLSSMAFNVGVLRRRWRELDPDELDSLFEEIESCCHWQERTISSLVEQSKAEIPIDMTLGAVFDHISEMMGPMFRQSSNRLVIDVDRAMRIRGMRMSLEHIFTNLINNAVESQKAPVTVTISCKDAPGSMSNVVTIAVGDDGPGISPDSRARIFDPFYTSKASGTGLGLCLAREAARELGGDLRLLSSTADGTVFVVDLPLASSAGSR